MKGIVFTEFLELVEDRFGLETVEEIIADANVPSEGVYTAVDTYPHSELVSLVVALSKKSGAEVRELVRIFGHHMFGRFLAMHPEFFEPHKETFSFLESVDQHIHVEVRKLHSDAELPKFENQRDGNTLRLTYSSSRGFDALAQGLIEGSIAHFGEDIELSSQDRSEGKGTLVDFILTKKVA